MHIPTRTSYTQVCTSAITAAVRIHPVLIPVGVAEAEKQLVQKSRLSSPREVGQTGRCWTTRSWCRWHHHSTYCTVLTVLKVRVLHPTIACNAHTWPNTCSKWKNVGGLKVMLLRNWEMFVGCHPCVCAALQQCSSCFMSILLHRRTFTCYCRARSCIPEGVLFFLRDTWYKTIVRKCDYYTKPPEEHAFMQHECIHQPLRRREEDIMLLLFLLFGPPL